MRSTFSSNFQVRKNRVSKDDLYPIDVIITVNTERSRFTTDKKVKAENWDLAKQRVKGLGIFFKSSNFASIAKLSFFIRCTEEKKSLGNRDVISFFLTIQMMNHSSILNILPSKGFLNYR